MIAIEEASSFGPVQSASSTLNRALEGILDLALVLVEDSSDERGMNYGLVSDVGHHEHSCSVCYLHLVLFQLLGVG